MLALTILVTGVLAVASIGLTGRAQASLAAARTEQLVAVQQVLEALHSSPAVPASATSFVRVGRSRLEVSTSVEELGPGLFAVLVATPPLGPSGTLEVHSRLVRRRP